MRASSTSSRAVQAIWTGKAAWDLKRVLILSAAAPLKFASTITGIPALSWASISRYKSSMLAAPRLFDHERSFQPRLSNNASLMPSFVSSGTPRSSDKDEASVVLPAPGGPETMMSTFLAISDERFPDAVEDDALRF